MQKILHLNTDPQIKLTPESILALQPDTSHWLTRNQAADSLHISVTTIANYERRGKLHPRYAYRPDGRGIERHVAVYDPLELCKLPGQSKPAAVREPGEVAARCFELFEQGRNVKEVVIELRETPERVRELHNVWLDSSEGELLITKGEKELLEKLIGSSFANASEFLILIQNLVKRAT